jgi:hypothetical protein
MGINDDLTVEQLLNVMEKMHKTAFMVLQAHGVIGGQAGSEQQKKEALEELKQMTDVFAEYR